MFAVLQWCLFGFGLKDAAKIRDTAKATALADLTNRERAAREHGLREDKARLENIIHNGQACHLFELPAKMIFAYMSVLTDLLDF